jgi:type IV pilus assembly protein PilV
MAKHFNTVGRTGSRVGGFSLVEVLVSLVILSMGLLGIAKLVMVTSHANDSAYLRSQATQLAYEILDNMRANRQIAVAGGYDTALGTMPANPGTCAGVACTPANVALYDVYRWKQRLGVAVQYGALPSGAGSIVTTTAGGQTTAVITVQWDDAVAQSNFKASAEGVAAPLSVTLESVL